MPKPNSSNPAHPKLRPSPTRIKPTERVVVPPMNVSPERLAKALFRIKPASAKRV